MTEAPSQRALLPCPFCGGSDLEIADTGFRWVVCACEVEGPPHKTEAEAIAAWNTRSAPIGDEVIKRVANALREVFYELGEIDPDNSNGQADLETLARAAIEAIGAPVNERAAIVAWLRAQVAGPEFTELYSAMAGAIERGDHLGAPVEQESEWRTIESAPKDGTDILAVIAGTHTQTGRSFIPEVVSWESDESGGYWWNCMWPAEQMHTLYEPTHWRPLPTPPKATP